MMNKKKPFSNVRKRRTLRGDKRAVSPVIAVILMIAIVVVVAAIIASFAYSMATPNVSPQAALSMEGATAGSNEFFIQHGGGDAIVDACAPIVVGNIDDAEWENMQVRINGEICSGDATDGNPAELELNEQELNGVDVAIGMFDFTVGDRLRLYTDAGSELALGDEIVVIHVPTQTILASHTVLW